MYFFSSFKECHLIKTPSVPNQHHNQKYTKHILLMQINLNSLTVCWLINNLNPCIVVNTKNWYRKETDLWAEFGKETPFGRKFSSKDSVKMPAVGSAPSFDRRVVLHLEKEAFGNT
jgi:hypothetical protein